MDATNYSLRRHAEVIKKLPLHNSKETLSKVATRNARNQ